MSTPVGAYEAKQRDRWNAEVNKQEFGLRLLTEIIRERCPMLANAVYLKGVTLHERATVSGGEILEVHRFNSDGLDNLIKETAALIKLFLGDA